jgi:choline-sulfatase
MGRAGKLPNILFVMFDQMAALSLPSYGHPVVKAPNIARLASRGTLFENAYCTAPLCSPSRFGMLTGMLPSRFGAYDNASELPAEIPTFLHHLRGAGYRTCLSGKMDFTGADQLHGFEERLTTDLSPSDFGWVPDWEHPDAVQPWFHTLQSVAEAGPCEYSLSLQYDEDACDRGVDWLQQVTGEKGASENDDRPFMLTVSVMQPHDPYQGLRRFWDLYSADEIDMPAEPKRKAGRRSQIEERMYRLYDRDEIRLSPRQIRDARRAYYAMISYCDDLLGRLMRALEIAGVADETIVIVTSDHGDMLGERGLWYKMNFYDRAIRVPLIVAGPGIKRQRVKAPVSHLDLLPTFLDLAGKNIPRDGLDGASLWPSLRRGVAPKGELAGEYCGEGYDAPVAMIRRGRHKFLHSRHLQPELYDLDADAGELRNLAQESGARKLVEALTAEAEARWDLDRLRTEVIASQRRRRLVHQALVTGRVAAWDFAPKVDAAAAYYRNYDPKMPDPDRILRRPSRGKRRGGA